MSRGFTLIQISILLTVASLVLVTVLPSIQGQTSQNSASTKKLNTVLTALRQFQTAEGRLPCPADASEPTGDTNYGVEAANNGATNNCSGSTPAANSVDATNHVAIGMVPFRTLGLTADQSMDSYTHHITYAVDTNATSCWTSANLTGQISVTDNGVVASTVAALVSHGADGHGVWIPLTGSTGTAVRLNSGSTDANQLINAHVDSSFVATSSFNNFVALPRSTTFDDLLVYKNSLWTLNSLSQTIQTSTVTVLPPANATYSTGQTLDFTLTFPKAVTVTGTPRLILSALGSGSIGTSNVAYANYVSGSGTTALLFRYTVVAADTAPTGISVTSPIDTTGGSLSVCYTFFAVPDLSNVKIAVYLYASDRGTNVVYVYDTSGNLVKTIGSSGSGNGQFNKPAGIAVDTSGNIWVVDYSNNRVQKFDYTGTYVSQFGTAGSGNGQFNNPIGIRIDGSGNLWVVEENNNRVQKFNSSGTYVSKFGTAGSGNGQFNHPYGLNIDGSGNIWVADMTNHRVQKFNSSGTYQSQFGTSGTGNGQFNSPTDIFFLASGNIWVMDRLNNRVQTFNSSGTYQSQFGAAGSGNGQFSSPVALASDGTYVWVTDFGNARIQKFDTTGTYQSKFSMPGSYPTNSVWGITVSR